MRCQPQGPVGAVRIVQQRVVQAIAWRGDGRLARHQGASLATMDGRLADNAYLAGDDYSIADIASFGWLHIAQLVGFDFSAWPHVGAWYAGVAARPAVQLGITLPAPATGA